MSRNLKLTFLGTGTSQGVPVIGCTCAVCTSADPRDHRLRSSALVEVDGKRLLIDAGPDLRQQMLRADVRHLDAVLLTHEHMDHIVGMDDLRAFSFMNEPPWPVPIHASPRTLEAVRRVFSYAFTGPSYPGIPQFDLHPVHHEEFQAAGVTVLPVEVMHLRLPVLGFRILDLCYITDAKTIVPDEMLKMKGCKVMVINALRLSPHISHFNLEEALAVVEQVGPERAYLTHISHLMGPHATVRLPAGVELATDGLVVEVPC